MQFPLWSLHRAHCRSVPFILLRLIVYPTTTVVTTIVISIVLLAIIARAKNTELCDR